MNNIYKKYFQEKKDYPFPPVFSFYLSTFFPYFLHFILPSLILVTSKQTELAAGWWTWVREINKAALWPMCRRRRMKERKRNLQGNKRKHMCTRERDEWRGTEPRKWKSERDAGLQAMLVPYPKERRRVKWKDDVRRKSWWVCWGWRSGEARGGTSSGEMCDKHQE